MGLGYESTLIVLGALVYLFRQNKHESDSKKIADQQVCMSSVYSWYLVAAAAAMSQFLFEAVMKSANLLLAKQLG